MNWIHTLSREETRRVSCPECNAVPGSPCSEPASGSRREHHHASRVTAARRFATRQRTGGGAAANAIRQRVADRMFRP